MIRIRITFLSFCVLLAGCTNLLVNAPKTNQNVQDLSTLADLVRMHYVFLQFKQIQWDSIVNAYQPLFAQSNGDEIYPLLYRILGELKDGHVELYTCGGFPIQTYQWPRETDEDTYSPLVVRRYFGNALLLAGSNNMEYGILPGNIGYCYISTFTEGNGQWPYEIDNILKYFESTRGMIIDVRNNGGGSDTTWDVVVSRFARAPINYHSYLSNGSPLGNFSIVPAGQYPYYKPVVVLINGATFSAAELFADLMRQIPAVTLVGDTTGGGGGNGINAYYLPSGLSVKLPIAYVRRFDGTMIEWNGVPPDVYVGQTVADVNQGRDKQLEKAIGLLQ